MKALPPRAVVVSRPSERDELLMQHGTLEQARFVLESRGQRLDDVLERHELQRAALHAVAEAIPSKWRRTRVLRHELDRFLFARDDVILAVGQDGLVANVAKYACGQPVIGINPSKAHFAGVLVRHPAASVAELLESFERGELRYEERSMVQARLSDGLTLLALNEIYVGHVTHQSSRYRIHFQEREERHSSSGLIVASGTGATGWAKSISTSRLDAPPLPGPLEVELAFLVREAWPSITTGTAITAGRIRPGEQLTIVSEMNEGGTVFGDGIESDHLTLTYGQRVVLSRAEEVMRLAA